jgi:hypothetical protein
VPAGRFGYSILRVMDGSPATAGKRCRGYSENAGDLIDDAQQPARV